MNDTQILEQLRAARAVLERAYVKWTANDGKGGYCAIGAVCVAANCRSVAGGFKTTDEAERLLGLLHTTAAALHPELRDQIALRDGGGLDVFSSYPLPFVNNQLGKAATLAVFDAAILDLEIKLAGSPSIAEPQEAEVCA